MTLALGVLAALAAAALYSAGVTLQAVEAAKMPDSESLRPALLRHLLTRRRWLLGSGCVLGGWVMQAVALTLAPITVVQPALGLSVVALLFIGCRWFGQSTCAKEILAAVGIAAGVAGLVAVSPGHSDAHGRPLVLAIGMTVLGLVAIVPFFLKGRNGVGGLIAVSAGMAYAWTGFSTKFLADGLTAGTWPVVLVWLGATVAAGVVGLLSEMTALQHRSAIRVFPVVLVVQIVVAVLLAPLLAGEGWSPDPLVLVGLGVSLAVVAAATRALAGSSTVEAAMVARDA